MAHDNFGDRLKKYEREFTETRLNKHQPVYARLDGRSFSKFTKNMIRPFDPLMSKTMVETTEYLVDQTNAVIGYTQSDEISLIWNPVSGEESQLLFDGKIQKLASVLAAMCSAKFVMSYAHNFGRMPHRVPSFDCRIINVPNYVEAGNMMLWRQQDCIKNSVQSAAHYHFGHKALMHKTTKDKIKMLRDDGIDFFKSFPDEFRVGTCVTKITETRLLTEDELKNIPEKYRPTEPVVRNRIERDYPLHIEKRYINAAIEA